MDEVLGQGAKGFLNITGKLKKLLKDILIGYNVAARFSVVQRAAAALGDNPELSGSASEKVSASFMQILERLAPTEGFQAEIKEILSAKVQLLAEETNRILPLEMKDFAAAIIFGSFLEAFQEHFGELINTVNFGKVTEEVVRAMRPQEIEAMFYSFAGKYFQRLEIYGIWGGVLGILSLVS